VTVLLAVSAGLIIGIVVVAIVAVLALVLVGMYNGLVRKRNSAEAAWAQVDVQLKRRHDLIPNLVESVKGYAAHERGTFDEVTQARTAAQQAQGPQAQAAAENVLTQALGRLFAVAENYPQLRATENFQQLQAQLSETETNIATSREAYNSTVLTYDNALETLPTSIIAGIFNFRPREYFQADDADRAVPQVSFTDTAAPPASGAAPPAAGPPPARPSPPPSSS
jgi:LemA protein